MKKYLFLLCIAGLGCNNNDAVMNYNAGLNTGICAALLHKTKLEFTKDNLILCIEATADDEGTKNLALKYLDNSNVDEPTFLPQDNSKPEDQL